MQRMDEKPKHQLVLRRNLQVSSTTSHDDTDLLKGLRLIGHLKTPMLTFSAWPVHFPVACPPQEAQPDNLEAYRIIDGSVATPQDFESHVAAGKPFNANEHCRACGISIYKNLDDAKKTRDRFKPLRHKKIAKIKISENDGVVMQTSTPSSHFTWWMTTSAPESCFVKVEAE